MENEILLNILRIERGHSSVDSESDSKFSPNRESPSSLEDLIGVSERSNPLSPVPKYSDQGNFLLNQDSWNFNSNSAVETHEKSNNSDERRGRNRNQEIALKIQKYKKDEHLLPVSIRINSGEKCAAEPELRRKEIAVKDDRVPQKQERPEQKYAMESPLQSQLLCFVDDFESNMSAIQRDVRFILRNIEKEDKTSVGNVCRLKPEEAWLDVRSQDNRIQVFKTPQKCFEVMGKSVYQMTKKCESKDDRINNQDKLIFSNEIRDLQTTFYSQKSSLRKMSVDLTSFRNQLHRDLNSKLSTVTTDDFKNSRLQDRIRSIRVKLKGLRERPQLSFLKKDVKSISRKNPSINK